MTTHSQTLYLILHATIMAVIYSCIISYVMADLQLPFVHTLLHGHASTNAPRHDTLAHEKIWKEYTKQQCCTRNCFIIAVSVFPKYLVSLLIIFFRSLFLLDVKNQMDFVLWWMFQMPYPTIYLILICSCWIHGSYFTIKLPGKLRCEAIIS